MTDMAGLNGLRFIAEMSVPGTAVFLEALIRVSRALCEYAQDTTCDRNQELRMYLDAFLFRVESERHEGRLPSEEWMLQFQSLFDRIRTHVVESERNNRLAALFSASEERAQVDRFREEIKALQMAMTFNDPSRLKADS